MADESLLVTEGAASGTRIALEQELTIGRTADAEGRLGDDPELSREHARVGRDSSGSLQIEDLGSTNGTVLNGKRLEGTAALKPGDLVKLGTTTLQVLDASGKAPAATRLGTTPSPAGRTTAAASPPTPAAVPAPSPPPPQQPPRPQPRTPFPAGGGPAPGGTGSGGGGKRSGGLIAAVVVLVILVVAGIGAILYVTGGLNQVIGSDNSRDATVRVAVSLGDIPATVAQTRAAGGTGVVIDAEEGVVLTNEHVVRGGSALEVFKGSERASARVVARAPCDDLAVLQLDPAPSNLESIDFGDAEDLEAGDRVIALGYPLSASGSGGQSRRIVETEGPVSVPETSSDLGAELPRYRSVIQHQAPISGGNSGGPLVDDSGDLVGLNTFGTNSADLQGQFYAIQSNYIEDLLPDLREGKGRNDVGWALQPPADGGGLVNIDESEPGSPADRAGIRLGDLVVSVGGTSVRSFSDVCRVLSSRGPGDRVAVRGVHARNGRAFSAQVRLR